MRDWLFDDDIELPAEPLPPVAPVELPLVDERLSESDVDEDDQPSAADIAALAEYSGAVEDVQNTTSEVADAVGFALFGRNLFGDEIKPTVGPLAARFEWPPFSVLDARSGPWQDRKRAWLALGIQSELGRGAGTWVESEATGGPDDRQRSYKDRAAPGGSLMPAADYSERARGDGRGRPIK